MFANFIVALVFLSLASWEYKMHSNEINSTLKSLCKCSILGYPLYITFNVVVMVILELPMKQEYKIIGKIISALKNGVKIDLGTLEIGQAILGVFVGFSIIQCILFLILDIMNYYFTLDLGIDINDIYFGINITSALTIGIFSGTLYMQTLCMLLSIITSPFAYFRVSEAFKFNKLKGS